MTIVLFIVCLSVTCLGALAALAADDWPTKVIGVMFCVVGLFLMAKIGGVL